MRCWILVCALAPIEVEAVAQAKQPELVVEQVYSAQAVSLRNPGSKMRDALGLPSGALEVAAELALLTSSVELAGASLALTDLGLLRMRARRSFGGQLELFAATQLLAKQPRALDAALWQGATAGAQWLFTPQLGLSLQASAGPVLDGGDGHLGAGATLSSKHEIDHHVHFELGAGYAWTGLDLDARGDRWSHVHEAHAYAEAQLGERSGGMFARFAYHLPFATAPGQDRGPDRQLDPSVQLNVQIGAVLIAGDARDWDIYAACTIVDRGDAQRPASSLPILDGGFDQQQWTFGVTHRFGADPPARTAH